MSAHDCPVSHVLSLSTSVEVLLSEDGGQHISISDAFIKGKCILYYSLFKYFHLNCKYESEYVKYKHQCRMVKKYLKVNDYKE